MNTTNQPELGAPGVAGGGRGGVGSALTTQSTPAGGRGFGPGDAALGGGLGGETGYGPGGVNNRRGAGGGGGALADNQPVHPNPDDASNEGLIAEAGRAGTPTGLGAISQSAPPLGGGHGSAIFVDANPMNDFWGRRLIGGGVIGGELSFPVAGQGGGAGGDAGSGTSFPITPFSPTGDEKGSGGGGGGGLGFITARRMTVSATGSIHSNGGDGGGGENTLFFNRVGGGSGGGSGGYLVLSVWWFDLSEASADAIQAFGGAGGMGRDDNPDDEGAGGNGGPGVIQIHTPNGTQSTILLPPGHTLDELTTPNAYVLLPLG